MDSKNSNKAECPYFLIGGGGEGGGGGMGGLKSVLSYTKNVRQPSLNNKNFSKKEFLISKKSFQSS